MGCDRIVLDDAWVVALERLGLAWQYAARLAVCGVEPGVNLQLGLGVERGVVFFGAGNPVAWKNPHFVVGNVAVAMSLLIDDKVVVAVVRCQLVVNRSDFILTEELLEVVLDPGGIQAVGIVVRVVFTAGELLPA